MDLMCVKQMNICDATVGFIVGAVGIFVGYIVGFIEDTVGVCDGNNVGRLTTVGDIDGFSVGDIVGYVDGDIDGIFVGCNAGFDGDIVGVYTWCFCVDFGWYCCMN